MKIYGVKFDCNTPSPKKISVPLNSQFQVNFQVAKNGEMIDFTAAGAPELSVSYNGTALSCDRYLNSGPVFQIDTGNVATRQSVKAALPGSEFNLFVELTDGDVYEIDEVGGGGFDPSELSDYYTKSETSSAVELSDAFASVEPSIPTDLSVDSITFSTIKMEEEEVEADRKAIMVDGDMVVDGSIEATSPYFGGTTTVANLEVNGDLAVPAGAISSFEVNTSDVNADHVFANMLLSASTAIVGDGEPSEFVPGGDSCATKIINDRIDIGLTKVGDSLSSWLEPRGHLETYTSRIYRTLEVGADNDNPGEFDMNGSLFSIHTTQSEYEGEPVVNAINFQIDPEDTADGNIFAIWGAPQVLIGPGGYLDFSLGDVRIDVVDPFDDQTVSLVPTRVTIDGTDYVIMAADVSPQP